MSGDPGAAAERVLVLDGERASTLAIVRSLGRRGIVVDVGSAVARPLAARSRHAAESLRYPDPTVDPAGFQEWVVRTASERPYSLIIPVTDPAIVPLMPVRQRVESSSTLAMASNGAIEVTLSKSRSAELARSAGVPLPRTSIVRRSEEIETCLDSLALPVAIKPDRSNVWGEDGAGRRLSVTYGRTRQEARQKILGYLQVGAVTVQEVVTGRGVGMGVLAEAGEVLFAFQYRRLHEVPLTGGPSSYRESRPLDPTLLAHCEELMRRLRWDGVAMLEVKERQGDGTYCFMEINGRFWGSLPLAAAAGADFPFYLFELMVRGRREFPRTYEIGARSRDLRRELSWALQALSSRSDGSVPVRLSPERAGRRAVLRDTLAVLGPGQHLDTFRVRDPLPGLRALEGTVRDVLRRFADRLWARRARRRLARWKSRRAAELARRVRDADRIVVLCLGNHIRSPFAACLLSHWLRGTDPTIVSAGLDVIPGRRAHVRAVERARSHGLALDAHRASPLTERMAREADLILCMDVSHLLALHRRFPDARGKGLLLGCLAPFGPLEIADPETRGPEALDAAFEAIEDVVRHIA